MATTTVATGSGLNPTWVMEKVIAQYAERENYFAKFTGEGPNSIVQKLTQLEKKNGDNVKVTLFSKLGGPGVDGDATLEGNEEALTPYQDQLFIDQKRHAVRLAGRMTEQRSAIALRKQATYALGIWARDYMSELMSVYLNGARGTRTMTIIPTGFTGFAGNTIQAPDATHTLWAGAAGTEAGLGAGDKMTAALLDRAWTRIQLLINAGVPMKFPVIDGKPTPTVVVTPEQMWDLWQDPDFVAAQQFANVRGDKNPLIGSSDARWKGMVIFENPCGALITNGAGGANYARALILGCQAAVMAFGGEEGATDGGGGRWRSIQEEFDFQNQTGFAVATILGAKKLRFNGLDNGVFSLNTAYTIV